MVQINLNNPWIKIIKYLIFGITFHLVLGWFTKCSSDKKIDHVEKIVIPSQSGSFEPKKPESKPFEIKQRTITEVKKDVTIYITNPLNEKLVRENDSLKIVFYKMSDSLKTKAYDKAIELNSFSSRFEDKFMILNINGIVRGEVQEITPSYTRKEFEIESKQKESVFRLLAGAKIQSSIISPSFNTEGNLMFQNKRGDIISAGYSNKNLNELNKDVFSVGYYKSIFNIKK